MLSLATRLRAMDDESLRLAIAARPVSATGIRDFFDLAESLLDPASVQAALMHLDRATLAVLAVAGEPHADQLAEGAVADAAADAAALPGPTIEELTDRLTVLVGEPATQADVAARAADLDRLLLGRLLHGRLAPYDAVTAQLRRWPAQGLPSATELAAARPPAPLPAPSANDIRFADRLSTERAFAAVSAIAELVTELSREPARELLSLIHI